MAYIPLRSEKSLTELVDKVYSNLSATEREAAEAAMLKENPVLKEFSTIKRGTLIRIPQVKDIQPKRTRSIADPDGDLVDDYVQRLEIFSDALSKNNAMRNSEQKNAQAVLKKAAVKKILDTSPEASQLAEQLAQHISEDSKRRKGLETDSKKAFDTLRKDLEKLMR